MSGAGVRQVLDDMERVDLIVKDADEIQALIRYHCSAVVEAIDDGGIKPSQTVKLGRTIERLRWLQERLSKCPMEK